MTETTYCTVRKAKDHWAVMLVTKSEHEAVKPIKTRLRTFYDKGSAIDDAEFTAARLGMPCKYRGRV